MAGAGYKLFNTGDVLTAAQVNTYLMQQTVMVFASSAARTTALSGVLAEGMLSYLTDTNSTEYYDGSAWVGISLPSQSGNSGKYLTTNGTSASWGTVSAGGMTLLSTTTISGTSTTVSSIDQTYKHLLVIVNNVYTSTGGNTKGRFEINGTTSSIDLTGMVAGTTYVQTDAYLLFGPSSNNIGYTSPNGTTLYLMIYNYASTSYKKPYNLGGGGTVTAFWSSGDINSTTAITSLKLSNTDGFTFGGGTILIYGVN